MDVEDEGFDFSAQERKMPDADGPQMAPASNGAPQMYRAPEQVTVVTTCLLVCVYPCQTLYFLAVSLCLSTRVPFSCVSFLLTVVFFPCSQWAL